MPETVIGARGISTETLTRGTPAGSKAESTHHRRNHESNLAHRHHRVLSKKQPTSATLLRASTETPSTPNNIKTRRIFDARCQIISQATPRLATSGENRRKTGTWWPGVCSRDMVHIVGAEIRASLIGEVTEDQGLEMPEKTRQQRTEREEGVVGRRWFKGARGVPEGGRRRGVRRR